jgi:excisionase family DNA binding protein
MPHPNYESECEAEPEPAGRITVGEVSRRLNLGRLSIYKMLNDGSLPGIRLGRRWIITRHAFEAWERACGMRYCGAQKTASRTPTEGSISPPLVRM